MLVRRATKHDEDRIISFIGEEAYMAQKRYGEYSVLNLIETTYFTVLAENNNNEIVGFASFHSSPGPVIYDLTSPDHPALIPANNWEATLKSKFRIRHYNVRKS